MTTTHTTNPAAVRFLLKTAGLTVDSKDRVRGIYLEDGIVATVADLVAIHQQGGNEALVSLIAESTAIHG